MSRLNPSGHASSQQLWNAPVSGGSRTAAAQAAQEANEEAWRRSQEQQYYEQQQYANGDYEPQEPVDYDIYHKAVAVSSPRLGPQSGELDPRQTIKKTVLRRVEVPFTRSVQRPTQVTQLVPSTVEVRVPVKKLVQVPGFQTVNEAYVEYEDREAIREKEVWVKKIVPERYVERVPVQKVRQVQKPTSVIREVESWEVVQAPTTRRVVVPGFRTEEVPDSRVVEVEEEQTFALRPEPVGPNEIKSTRDLGRLANPHSHLPDAPYGSQGSGVPFNQSFRNGAPQPQQQQQPRSFGSSQGFNSRSPNGAAAASAAAPFGSQPNPLELLRQYGLGVDESHTRHTDGTGVVVTRLDRGGIGARAGLQTTDLITAVAGRPVQSVAEFVQLVSRAPNSVQLNVNRDGRRNIALVFNKN
jgi:hypothetical protein